MAHCNPNHCIHCPTELRNLNFAAGETIVKHGEAPKGLYLIRSGLVKLEISSASGTVFTLRVAKTGDFFGYRALLIDEPYYFSAVAMKECSLCLIPKVKLETALAKDPELSLAVIKQLAHDLKIADRRWLSQACEEVQHRVSRIIADLNKFLPRHHWTKKEIAQLAGTTTETVFRTLSKIKNKEKANL